MTQENNFAYSLRNTQVYFLRFLGGVAFFCDSSPLSWSSLFSFCSVSGKTSLELEAVVAPDVASTHSMTEVKVRRYKHAHAQNPRLSDNYKNPSDYNYAKFSIKNLNYSD